MPQQRIHVNTITLTVITKTQIEIQSELGLDISGGIGIRQFREILHYPDLINYNFNICITISR